MNVVKLYKKTLSFFSRARQEEIISAVEREFYDVISAYAQEKISLSQLQTKLDDICAKIRHHVMHYYFEDDLLDHFFNLMTLITNYSQEIGMSSVNKTSDAAIKKISSSQA